MNPNRFNYQPKTYILRYEELPGLEVVMRAVSVGQLLDMATLADQVRDGSATLDQAGKLFSLFGGCIRSWNLDLDGEAVPASADGLRSLDTDLFLQIFNGWFEGMTRAPKASTKPAEPSGPTLQDLQDLPMAPLRAV